MKSILQEIQADLHDFISDPGLSLLVVSCEIEHSALMLKSLEALEQDPATPDLFLIFGHEFDHPSGYVEGILLTVRQQLAQLNEGLAESGAPPWPDLPDQAADPSLSPAARLVLVQK